MVVMKIFLKIYEPLTAGLVPREDLDQPEHTPSLIRVFLVCIKKA